jgi:hypothetical protein
MRVNMTRKPSTTKLALAVFIITLVSTLSVVVYMQSYYHSSYVIYASKLNEKPAHCFVLENPDTYLLEAITTQDFVTIGSPEDTQIDDLLTALATSYFEYNGDYYGAGFGFETKASPVYMFLVVFALTAVPAVSITAVVSAFKKRVSVKKQSSFLKQAP